jgi:riboflavin synthase
MFTGLVQGTGRVDRIDARSGQSRLTLRPHFAMHNVELGESISVNGVCLTVETWDGAAFTAYASAETLSKSNLGELSTGASVNLERALALGDRLGGHLVSGHVDCIASVDSVRPAGESTIYRLAFPEEFGRLVVPKGSIALDGISLTVNECGSDWLEVNIIPATTAETNISSWRPGARVNMETDLLGKYVERMLGPWLAREKGAITEDFLRKHGF